MHRIGNIIYFCTVNNMHFLTLDTKNSSTLDKGIHEGTSFKKIIESLNDLLCFSFWEIVDPFRVKNIWKIVNYVKGDFDDSKHIRWNWTFKNASKVRPDSRE